MKLNRKAFYISTCCVLFLSFVVLMFNAWHNVAAQTTETSELLNKPIIVIDSGHGGEDGGAVGNSGVLEKDINLDIALKLKKMFTQNDFDVIMVREKDESIYDSSANTIRDKKRSDLNNRLKMFNKSQNNVVISIHQNKFTDSKYSGTQVFYSTKNPSSEKLAQSVRGAVVGLIQPTNTRECKPADKNIFLLYNATVPAIIVECGFLSNPQEEQLLNTDEYRENIAFSIYMGFLEYNKTEKG